MNLATLLPGIREIRTPLLAGYLWLISLWVASEPALRRAGLPKPFRALADTGVIDTAALTVATSFAALLIGIIMHGIYTMCVHTAQRRLRMQDDPVRNFLGWRPLHRAIATGMGRLEAGPTKAGLQSLNLLSLDHVRDSERLLERTDHDLADVIVALGLVDDTQVDMNGHIRDALRAVGTSELRDSIAAWLALRVLDERELVARRLAGDSSPLHSEYDRLRAESELRMGIAPALSALIVALAVVWQWWIAFSLLALPVLIHDAVRKGDAAGDLLVDALVLGKVDAPVFERLRRISGELASEQPSLALIAHP